MIWKKERKKERKMQNPLHNILASFGLGASHDTGGVEFWHEPERAGWLMKQGDVVKTWRRRWFVPRREAVLVCRRGGDVVVADARRGGREPVPFREGRGGHAEQAARVRAEQPDGHRVDAVADSALRKRGVDQGALGKAVRHRPRLAGPVFVHGAARIRTSYVVVSASMRDSR